MHHPALSLLNYYASYHVILATMAIARGCGDVAEIYRLSVHVVPCLRRPKWQLYNLLVIVSTTILGSWAPWLGTTAIFSISSLSSFFLTDRINIDSDPPSLISSSELRELSLRPSSIQPAQITIIHPQLRDLILPLERANLLYPRGTSVQQISWQRHIEEDDVASAPSVKASVRIYTIT